MNTKVRLAVMNFLEFAVWGAYLTCMGNYLGKAGLGENIAWFYAIQGIVSIFMPTLMPAIAWSLSSVGWCLHAWLLVDGCAGWFWQRIAQ